MPEITDPFVQTDLENLWAWQRAFWVWADPFRVYTPRKTDQEWIRDILAQDCRMREEQSCHH